MRNPWTVVKIMQSYYTIYRKTTNEEYTDKHGDNLMFETRGEASSFIRSLGADA